MAFGSKSDIDLLVSCIRNSVIVTNEETGQCELIPPAPASETSDITKLVEMEVAEAEDTTDNPRPGKTNDTVKEDKEFEQSPDVELLRLRPRRMNQRERTPPRKISEPCITERVRWKTVSHTVEEYGEHFERKEVSPRPATLTSRKSALSLQLEEFDLNVNPFMEYAKFDGRAGGSAPAKKIDIFCMMMDRHERQYPMTVVVLSSAKIFQLIGLICWQYTMESRQPPLSESNVDAYSLHIMEDDGEIDLDFPPLENREPVSKFGFDQLGLVVNHASRQSVSTPIMVPVTVWIADGSKIQFSVKASTTSLHDVLIQTLVLRNIAPESASRYRLERKSVPGTALDLSQPFYTTAHRDLCLLRENSAWPSTASSNDVSETFNLVTQPSRVYDVSVLHKLRPATPAQLCVSSEKITLNPSGGNVNIGSGFNRLSRRSFMFGKQKVLTYPMESVAACVLQSEHSSSCRSVIRIIYAVDRHFKHCNIECNSQVASEIVAQIDNILRHRPGIAHDQHVLLKNEKSSGKNNIIGRVT